MPGCQFGEEHVGHHLVVVLSGVDDDLVDGAGASRLRHPSEIAAALTNWGRAPTTVRILMERRARSGPKDHLPPHPARRCHRPVAGLRRTEA